MPNAFLAEKFEPYPPIGNSTAAKSNTIIWRGYGSVFSYGFVQRALVLWYYSYLTTPVSRKLLTPPP